MCNLFYISNTCTYTLLIIFSLAVQLVEVVVSHPAQLLGEQEQDIIIK